jgi:hypothetical protein
MRNLAEAQSTNMDPRASRQARKAMLERDLQMSRTATASMGKFDKKLNNEPKQKGIRRKVIIIIYTTNDNTNVILFASLMLMKAMPMMNVSVLCDY